MTNVFSLFTVLLTFCLGSHCNGGAFVYCDQEALEDSYSNNSVSVSYPNSFAVGLNPASRGYINGEISSVDVEFLGDNQFVFSIQIGQEIFVSTSITPEPNGLLSMVSVDCNENMVVFSFAADVSDINTSNKYMQTVTAFSEAMKISAVIKRDFYKDEIYR